MPLLVRLAFCAALSFGVCAAQEHEALTLDVLQRVNFSGTIPHGLEWLDAAHYLEHVRGRGRNGLMRVDAASGATEPLFSTARMEAAFRKIRGIGETDAHAIVTGTLTMNTAHSAALVHFHTELYYYVFDSDEVLSLAESAEPFENMTFSPDGQFVCFVKDHNLYMVSVKERLTHALTKDGGAKLLNGKLDWVYQEEVYGRGDFIGYWWSPDSRRIAFLQLDESPVKEFTLVDQLPVYQELEKYTYPKAGTPNPKVKLGIVEIDSGKLTWVDTASYSKDEPIIARVGWKPDSASAIYYISNREQTWLDVRLADPAAGTSQTLFREHTPAWIETDHLELPYWLDDGTFLFLSERDGWRHLYHYAADGKLLHQVTTGKWEVQQLHGVDPQRKLIFFSANEHSPIATDIYRIQLDGGALKRLSNTEGSHHAAFSLDMSYYIDTWSDASTPPQVRVHSSSGEPVRTLAENKVAALEKFGFSNPEFLQVKTRDGFLMEAMLIKPLNFDPAKKYPVWSSTYSGPHMASVHNSWDGGEGMWRQMLAQKGYLIWVCDNRSASGKGAESAWTSYKQFGMQELRDLEDGVAYLKSLPFVDGARIGLSGWSFGGFMTSYAMTHSKLFKVGIAGGSVTDWHLYDSIYTERYMLTPEHNPAGYASSSVVSAAKNLHGKLLLIHGTMDDNVHLQNTLQFIYELQKAGKQFDLMLYPKSGHGIGDPAQSHHLRELTTKYILDNL